MQIKNLIILFIAGAAFAALFAPLIHLVLFLLELEWSN